MARLEAMEREGTVGDVGEGEGEGDREEASWRTQRLIFAC